MTERDRPQTQSDDLVREDDAIIGRVFRRSLAAIGVVVVLAFVAGFLLRDSGEQEQVLAKDFGEIADLVPETSILPDVRFVDITEAAGIDFVHSNGARGGKLLPETMGGGVAFLDYDIDGDPDLLLVNSDDWPGEGTGVPVQALYRNDGSGRFENVTRQSGLALRFFGMGVAAADYDADGDPDLFLTALGPNRLLRNDDGRFVDVTGSAGVAGGASTWSSSAGFFDHDNDGDLDLFVGNYVRWSREIDIELDFSLNGKDRAYGPPTNYEGVHPYLYRNEGDGTFVDVSAEAGIEVVNPTTGAPVAKALGLYFADVDEDGRVDVLVSNDTVQNFLFHNLGGGRFEELGAVSGMGFDSAGNATGAMGIDLAHHRNDRQLAVAIGNFANEMSSLYVSQQRRLQFTDESAGEGIGSPSRSFLSFGLFFFDYDLDGRSDLLQANGHLEEEIHQVQASQQYRQPAQLFWNQGPAARSCFTEVPRDAVGDLSRPLAGRGAAYADIDADGDLDVVLTQTGGAPLLLRNDQALGNHWLRLRLRGAGDNPEAIGAWIEVTAGGETQRKQVMPTRSYLSQVELPVTFGLGAATAVDRVRVLWPDGSEQNVDALPVDGTHEIVEGG